MRNRTLSTIIKVGLLSLGLTGTSLLAATEARADASASGSIVVVRPSGGSFSVSGELTLPGGHYFDGPLTVGGTPLDAAAVGTNAEAYTTLTVTPGAVTAALAGDNPFAEAAAAALDAAVTAGVIEDQAALIRAGAGADGLD